MSTSFFVPRRGALPLYEQIYRRMVEEIRTGRLAAGSGPPPKGSCAPSWG